MIELKNVNKTYDGDSFALTDVNLTVNPGDIYGVIGKSGAGKSTLIRCVNLLERPTSGVVNVDGQDLMTLSQKQLRQARHNIGMIFQHFNLLSTRTVYDNIALPLELLKKSKADIEKAVTPLLELTGLTTRKNAYPSQLSGGQKQRVAIARALATRPKVLLCDEMTSALDPETTASILDLLKDINEQMQLSILLITHEMEVIKSIADYVAVIDKGRIIEQNNVVSIFKNPQTDMAKRLTQSALKPDLPKLLARKLQAERIVDGRTIIRIAFTGQSAARPILDDLIRHYNVQVNILQANLEFLHHDTIGMMIISARGGEKEINQAMSYLVAKDLGVEVLGYVATDDWIIN